MSSYRLRIISGRL
jgi:regulator of protease activity HflC (stomatin/prohibitin superfamily)